MKRRDTIMSLETHRKKVIGTIFVLGLLLLATCTIAVEGYTYPAPVPLGEAANFAVLAGSTVTNTGSSVITGDVGVSPGSAVTGFPPGIVNAPGTIYAADTTAANAQSDLTTAYNDAVAATPVTADLSGQDLGGKTLTPGVYHFSSSAQLTGILTLNGGPSDVWVFQIGSTLTTASNSEVVIGNAQPCNVIWQVGSSATLGTDTAFVGTILAHDSITANTGVTVEGRLLALTAAVTLDTNTVNNTIGQISFPMPESALGALTAVGVCFAAFGVIKMKRSKNKKQ
jgi:Ice-binding-like